MVVVILNEVRHRRSGRRRGEGGIVAAAAAASVLNESKVLESTPSIVPSSVIGSMGSLVSTPSRPPP